MNDAQSGSFAERPVPVPPDLSPVQLAYATPPQESIDAVRAARVALKAAVINWVGGPVAAYLLLMRFRVFGKLGFLTLCALLVGVALIGIYEARTGRRGPGITRVIAVAALIANVAALGALAIGFVVSMVVILYTVSR